MTLFKLVSVGFLAAAAAWCTPSASAGESENPEANPKPSFETVDANRDGVITPSEAQGSWLASEFADVDANQDGLVNRNEYETAIS
jgi:hypothetical protein